MSVFKWFQNDPVFEWSEFGPLLYWIDNSFLNVQLVFWIKLNIVFKMCKLHIDSNHLNTKHLKSTYLTFQTVSLADFQMVWSVIWRTIWIPDILDHKMDIFVRISDHRSKYGPFDNPTRSDHLNTRLQTFSSLFRSWL